MRERDPGDDERGDTIWIWVVVVAILSIPVFFFAGAVLVLTFVRSG